jgi:HD-GYP domain-containing protein (c-di-GMP phosphodiesterase class II)
VSEEALENNKTQESGGIHAVGEEKTEEEKSDEKLNESLDSDNKNSELIKEEESVSNVGNIFLRLDFEITMRNLEFISPFVHSKCVQIGGLSIGIMKVLGMALDEEIVYGAYCANIGLAAIPQSIYHSPTLIDEPNREIIKLHVNSSYNMIIRVSGKAAEIALNHHELSMGKGYLGKKDNEVAKESFVVGIVERFLGSLSIHRSMYKPQSSFLDAYDNAMESYKGTTHIFNAEEQDKIGEYLYTFYLSKNEQLNNAFDYGRV